MKGDEIFQDELANQHAISYFKLVHTAGRIEAAIKQALAPFDLTHARLNILFILAKNSPHPMTAAAIKEAMVVSNPDVTRLIDKLVKREFVKRETCPENRRKMDISITKKGLAFFSKAHFEAKDAVNNYFKSQITRKEALELGRILEKMKL